MADRAVLVSTAGPLQGTVFPLEEGGLKIGRAEDNDVVIRDDDGISRYHATLLFDHGSLWLRDAGSRNGVFVNDRRVTDHKELSVGDVVRLGASTFTVRWESDAKAPEKDGKGEAPEGGSKPKRWYWPFE
jgi:pSer/pThr/pTyr-binding forkhead associated (FHA) protein